MKENFNNYSEMPEIPYKILLTLTEKNDNIFKLLKYDGFDALKKDNLTIPKKMQLLYRDNGIESDKRIFLKPLVGDEITQDCTQLRIFKYGMIPTTKDYSILLYEFDIICGSKISLVNNENDIPCSRIDIIESELLNTLNGLDAFGVGYFQFNRELSSACSERLSISNSKNFFGSALVFGVKYMNVKDNYCG